jgi:hypothetical protein
MSRILVRSHSIEAGTSNEPKNSAAAVVWPLAWLAMTGLAMAGWTYGISWALWKLAGWLFEASPPG